MIAKGSQQICNFSNVDLSIAVFVAVVIVMTFVAAVTFVDIVTLVAVVELRCDGCIMWTPLCRFHRVDFIV